MTADSSWTGEMPEIYARYLEPVLFAPFARHLAAAAAIASPRRVLELAAGTGAATRELVRRLPEAEITATDLNPGMVSWAAERVAGATWSVADAQELPFPDASFDLVMCQFGVMFFPSKPRAFAEVARVLSPSGMFLAAVWDTVDTSPLTAAMVASLAAVLPVEPPDFIVAVPHGYNDVERIAADLRAGGLEPDSIERVVLRGTCGSARELAQGFCLGSPLRFALEQRGSLSTFTAALADEMAARLGDGPLEADLGALVVHARQAG